MDLILVGNLDGRPLRHALAPGRHVIGRASDCDVVLAHPSVSRRHAQIEVPADGGVPRLSDLGSRNGTYLDGRRVEAPAPLQAGQALRVAELPLAVESEQAAAPSIFTEGAGIISGAEFSWDEIERPRHEDRQTRLFQILADAGELVAHPLPMDELLEAFLELVSKTFSPERAMLLLSEAGSPEPVVRASRVRGRRVEDQLVLSRTLVRRVLEERASLLTTDAQDDPRFSGNESVVLQRIRSAMVAPLFDHEDVIGLLYADTTAVGRAYAAEELRAFAVVAHLIAVKITQARLEEVEKDRRRLATELHTARDILGQLLPGELPRPAGWDICARLQPCSEVGGDLYDVRALADGRLAVVLGDVSGKGLGAALLASTIVTGLRILLEDSDDAAVLAVRLNRHVWLGTDDLRYATLFVGLLDPATGRLAYVNAGQVPPLVVRADGRVEEVGPTGLPVGLMEDGHFRAAELDLAPGDLLAVFSDGIPEAWNAEDEDYGNVRLRDALLRARGEPAAAVAERVTGDVTTFLAGTPPSDDVTVLVVRRS